ncbi:MAG TPA: ABC transporter transmembrane domain-containing protein [Candidatus Binataceae bacterium]|jgi:subfamily B ATP-binding cassette protein MsbA
MTRVISPTYLRLLKYLRRYLFPYVMLAVVSMLLLSATQGAIPFLAKRLVNEVYSVRDAAALHTLLLAILVLFSLRAVASFGNNYLDDYVGQKVTLDLRSELNERLQMLPLSFFNQTSTAAMTSRVIVDVTLIAGATSDGIFSLIGDSVSLVTLLGAAFYIDWKLTLIAAVVFPAAVLPLVQFSKRMRRMTRRTQKQLGGLATLLQETIQGNRVVKAFGMEDYERHRFNSELRRLFRMYMKVAAIKAFTTPMIELMAAWAVVGAAWYGAASVLSGQRSPGVFAAFCAALLLVYEPFKRLSRTNNSIQQGMAAAERLFEVLDLRTDVPEASHPLPLAEGRHSISFAGVGFRYGDQWALRNISLEIRTGEVVALVGMSGGGKSTLADLIPRFYDPQEGRILIDGVDIRRYSLRALRSQIGLVTQHTFLFNDTVRANIAYGSLEKSLEEISAAAQQANAHNFVTRLPQGYDTVVGEMGVRLSGGERQRLAIARALLKDAPILILDEATSALDSEGERLVQEALERLMQNRTTLVIAHRLSTVRRADKIAVMVRGRIVEEGTHEELIALGREYRKLYDLQFHDLQQQPGEIRKAAGQIA